MVVKRKVKYKMDEYESKKIFIVIGGIVDFGF